MSRTPGGAGGGGGGGAGGRAHTPRMSQRKKSLFELRPAALESPGEEEEGWEGRLGVAALDSSSSGDELPLPHPHQQHAWRETRSRTRRLLKESQDLKDFIKSPYSLRNYTARPNEDRRLSSFSTPATPHIRRFPGTPSSSHSTNSSHTTASENSRARKSLASLIADTESCSSSLKDLTFDSDTETDSKENTPKKCVRKSSRRKTMTPKFASFKGILSEQQKNITSSPSMDCTLLEKDIISPTQMLKTPHNTSVVASPPKRSHRRIVLEVDESPEDTDHRHKRHWNDSSTSESGPNPKNPKLDSSSSAPKARLSLFNSDKLKELLSAKSFYPKSTVELSPTVATKISRVISSTHNLQPKRSKSGRKSRSAGQINMGVRHRIRKPKPSKYRQNISLFINKPAATSNLSRTDATLSCQNSSQTSMANTSSDLLYDREKGDPFAKENMTIANLLSQWNDEEEVPNRELRLNTTLEDANTQIRNAETLLCFNKGIIEEDTVLLNPNAPVPVDKSDFMHNSDEVIMELGSAVNKDAPIINGSAPIVNASFQITNGPALNSDDVAMSDEEVESHGMVNGVAPTNGHFLPVEGGYILVDESGMEAGQEEELTDLDAIERELAMLDDQLSTIAKKNNIDPELILAPSEVPVVADSPLPTTTVMTSTTGVKLFPIFNKETVSTSAPGSPKGASKSGSNKKTILKTGLDQYIIDAGQKKIGATQCTECNVIYQIGDPQDEHDHLIYHNAVDVLRFPGWKEERVVGVYESCRCVCVRGTDSHWRKLTTLLERVVHPQLGYAAPLHTDQLYKYTAYLYICKKQIIGCLVAEPKQSAHKLVTGDNVDCVTTEAYTVKCGVSRLWTHLNHRRRSVATNLLNCMRASFMYGHVLDVDEIAFSSPTPAGKAFAAEYTGKADFYVYLD